MKGRRERAGLQPLPIVTNIELVIFFAAWSQLVAMTRTRAKMQHFAQLLEQ
jgi:hypothetical protein